MPYPPDPESSSSAKGLFPMIKPSSPTLVDIDIEYVIEREKKMLSWPNVCHSMTIVKRTLLVNILQQKTFLFGITFSTVVNEGIPFQISK